MAEKRKHEDVAQTARRVVDSTIARSEADDAAPRVARFGLLEPMWGSAQRSKKSVGKK